MYCVGINQIVIISGHLARGHIIKDIGTKYILKWLGGLPPRGCIKSHKPPILTLPFFRGIFKNPFFKAKEKQAQTKSPYLLIVPNHHEGNDNIIQ